MGGFFPKKCKITKKSGKKVSGLWFEIVHNINDQNDPESVCGIFSCFDLSSTESKEDRALKIDKIYEMFGHRRVHTLEDKW